jgi:NAD(P)-dependent dehydrogenase (short-subunit alcohol dehydrogenase family)
MTNPVVVITGASRGIGKRLAIDFAEAGYDVACLARSAEGHEGKLPGTVDETAEAARTAGTRAIAVPCDVSQEEQVADAARRVYEEFGRCDIVINNAAIAPPGNTLDLPTKLWRRGIDVNVNGPLYMTYYFAPKMLEAEGGRIINISSLVSVTPEFGRINYTVTKRALEGLTEGFAHELRGRIAVNCIRLELMVWSEGFVATLGGANKEGFEDPVIMSDACLWLAKQPIEYTGKILMIGEMREMGVVRGVTQA